MCCAQGECIAGLIGAAQVTESEWERAVKDFDLVIEDWNERTRRFAIRRPGYLAMHQLWKEADMPPEQRAAIPMPGTDITCKGKGGHCYVLGIAKGAGTSRGKDVVSYRCMETDELYTGTPDNAIPNKIKSQAPEVCRREAADFIKPTFG